MYVALMPEPASDSKREIAASILGSGRRREMLTQNRPLRLSKSYLGQVHGCLKNAVALFNDLFCVYWKGRFRERG